jgi:hypothetical protein
MNLLAIKIVWKIFSYVENHGSSLRIIKLKESSLRIEEISMASRIKN